MKKIILVVVIGGIIILVLAAGQYVAKNAKISREVSTVDLMDSFKKSPDIPLPQADFVKDGEMVLRDQDSETPTWRLFYGEPGNPAANVILNFNFRSKCDFGSGEQICSEKHYENGLRVHIEGIKSGSDVTVLTLKVLAEE